MAAKPSKLKMRRSSKFTLLLLASLIVVMLITLQQMNTELEYARAEQSVYAQRLAQLQTENAQLASSIANCNDPELIRDIARNELGMVGEGEKIFRFRN